MTEAKISKELFETEAEISKKLFEKIIANDLQGITVRDCHFQPVNTDLMLKGSTWQLEFHLSIHYGCRLLRALLRADEKTNNSQMAKYHENYVRINYPEEYKKYKRGM